MIYNSVAYSSYIWVTNLLKTYYFYNYSVHWMSSFTFMQNNHYMIYLDLYDGSTGA